MFSEFYSSTVTHLSSSKILLSKWDVSYGGMEKFWEYLDDTGLPLEISSIVVLADTKRARILYETVNKTTTKYVQVASVCVFLNNYILLKKGTFLSKQKTIFHFSRNKNIVRTSK